MARFGARTSGVGGARGGHFRSPRRAEAADAALRLLGPVIGRVTVAATAGLAIRQLVRAGDELSTSLNRLGSATGNVTTAAEVYDRLYAASLRTGAGVSDSISAFTRFSVAARDIGATNDQVLRLIAGIQGFGRLAGTSAAEMSAATLQLGQALASGMLQGDELRSILDADASALMWLSDAAPMWSDAATDMFAGGGYLAMAYQDELVFADPPPGARVLLRHTIEGEGAEIAYRVAPPMWGSGSDPMWSSDAGPMFGASSADWLAWPGVLVDPPGGLELRVRIAGGQNRGAIRRLQAALDAPRIDEAFADLPIAAGGTRLPIAQAYRGIGAVTVTLQGGTAALSAKLIDKNPTLGPLVQCFDSTGTGVAATVDAVITGY